VKGVWKATDFLSIVFDIFEIFNLKKYLPNINYSSYLMSIYFLNIIVLLLIIDIVYVAYSFSQKKFSVTWPLDILKSCKKKKIIIKNNKFI
jgi:hypothetical protein